VSGVLAFLCAVFSVSGCGVLLGGGRFGLGRSGGVTRGGRRGRGAGPGPAVGLGGGRTSTVGGGRLGGRRAARLLRALAVAGAALRRVTGARAPLSLEQRIAAAGAPAGLGPREVIAAKLATALCGFGVGGLLGAAAPGRLGPVLVAAAPASAFMAPDWWLRRRAAERARAARRELPALLDLLRVTVDAGLPPAAAFAAVGERAVGILAAEWRTVGSMCALGVPLREALAGLERRLPLPEVGVLVASLDRAARHGVPVSDNLAAQARDARLARRRSIEEDAARAGPKIQLVVALLLVPSVLLLVAAALAAALLNGGGLAIGG
jgi:tight adherence protein C